MSNLVSKACSVCGNEFQYERWNRKRVMCSMTCVAEFRRKNMKNKITRQSFVAKAKEIHHDHYSYDLTPENVMANEKVEIICPDHGTFTQTPSIHLKGSGCKLCKTRKPVKQFLEEAISVHGAKYDYSKMVYVDTKTKIEILCPNHGSFWQAPFQHSNLKSGCSECIKIIRSSSGELKWLDSLQVPESASSRQVRITIDEKTFIVDGIVGNTIYEYLGDYWHGNPAIYESTELNKSCKKTYGALYAETMNRFEVFKKAGYNVEYIWESLWLKRK